MMILYSQLEKARQLAEKRSYRIDDATDQEKADSLKELKHYRRLNQKKGERVVKYFVVDLKSKTGKRYRCSSLNEVEGIISG